MPGGHDTTIEVSNIMSFVLYTEILKQSVLKPASPGIPLNGFIFLWQKNISITEGWMDQDISWFGFVRMQTLT